MFSQMLQESFKVSISDVCSLNIREAEREEIKRETFIKGLSLLCCWMFAIVSRRKGMHKLVNRGHRCNRGSSLIE